MRVYGLQVCRGCVNPTQGPVRSDSEGPVVLKESVPDRGMSPAILIAGRRDGRCDPLLPRMSFVGRERPASLSSRIEYELSNTNTKVPWKPSCTAAR